MQIPNFENIISYKEGKKYAVVKKQHLKNIAQTVDSFSFHLMVWQESKAPRCKCPLLAIFDLLNISTRADFAIQQHQLHRFTPQLKAISESKQKKFCQLVIQKQTLLQSCPETSTANSCLVRAKGGF